MSECETARERERGGTGVKRLLKKKSSFFSLFPGMVRFQDEVFRPHRNRSVRPRELPQSVRCMRLAT